MIAVDTSTLIAYLAGEKGPDVEALDAALAHNQAQLPPVVVTETLSAPGATDILARLILALPALAIADGYWERAGHLRRRILARGLKAPLADALICQSCLDHGLALVTRDGDFKHFARHCGLKLA
ncbi:MAG: PIN domain-containing protein [Rhodospirillales bacterium]|nr:PIN domain-containing protein [Rhodospirillales bacterium]MSP80360.1 PIN domain-containing protein [Rhodospirillales bacterium]